ncbi:hypothetical protein JCM11641_006290 [Rhodosporidiobolus odoratus]
MVSTRSSRKTPKIMNPHYTQLYNVDQASSNKTFDEASADLAAFLDLSSFTANEALAPIAIPDFTSPASFTNAFAAPASTGALKPVDDSLLDSPLGLELSPAASSFVSSGPSSLSGSPYDFGSSTDFTSPMLSSYDGSPALEFESLGLGGNSMVDLPSLFAPVSTLPSSLALDIGATPQWAPEDVLAQLNAVVAAPVPMSSPMEDVKPMVSPTLTRLDSAGSLLFDFSAPPPSLPALPAGDVQVDLSTSAHGFAPPAPAPVAETTTTKRKTVAQLKKEAAALVEERAFQKDNFKGFRNTKKPMIGYDAPTLQKNYLTESSTSRKRTASATPAPASATPGKKARKDAAPSTAPAVELPAAAPEPIDADNLDEEQLSAIELKRRQNTLAARRSRMRKADHLKGLEDQINALKAINEQLMAENQRLREKCGEA